MTDPNEREQEGAPVEGPPKPDEWPTSQSLAEVQYVPAPHPSVIATEELLTSCRITAHRRGGPGGQHRNKVSSAILVLHEPTGISAEANERRDQAQNRRVAIQRLRLRLAILLRTQPVDQEHDDVQSIGLRAEWLGRPLKIAASNDQRHAVMALLLDDLHRSGAQPRLVAQLWQSTATSIVQFVAQEPAAFQLLNRWRQHHGLKSLQA